MKRLAMGIAFMMLGVLTSAADGAHPEADQPVRQRLIVLTDIGGDPDDVQSMVRLLLYSNDIDIEGLVATTSVWKQHSVSPEKIHAVVQAYAEVQPNLLKHDSRYPSGASIDALVKKSIAAYGMQGVGTGKDSEGSDWIVSALKKDDSRPLWITAWGGANTLAQALYKLRATETPAELARLVSKLRVNAISDQDDAGPWIRKTFPGLFYIVDPGGDYGSATWIAINSAVPDIDNSRISNEWLAANIQQGHGPLGAAYPDVSFGVEGDTPSWLNLIPNGLNDPEHPNWGGWGGRYELYAPKVAIDNPNSFVGGKPMPQETRPIWSRTSDRYTPPVYSSYGRPTKPGDKTFEGAKVTLWRWRDDFQNDFAARMDWTTKPYDEANHAPLVVLDRPIAFTVKSGQSFGVSADRSTDPDGDSFSYYWFVYPEAGTYKGKVDLEVENMPGIWRTAPKVTEPQTIHYIVKVTDKGTPALASYQRIVVTVTP